MWLIANTITLIIANVRVKVDEYFVTIVHGNQDTAVQLHSCSSNRA